MAIDISKRPDKEWLTLFESVTYLALGEALDVEALGRVDYPSNRAYGAEIKKAVERCRAEARMDTQFAEFLRLLGDNDRGKFTIIPRAADLRGCELSSSGEQLLDLVERLELAQAEEELKEAEAQRLLRRALDSRKVVFNGEREGRREDIDVLQCDGVPTIDFYADMIEAAPHRLSTNNGRMLKWIGVRVETASLLAFLEGKTRKDKPKRKRGRKVMYEWEKIEPIARLRFNKMPSADETPLIKAIQSDLAAAGLEVPARSTLQDKLIEWELY